MKKGWPTKRLADVILDIKDGGTPSRKNPEYFGGDVYWCVVKDIKPLIYDTAEKLTEDGLNNCSAKVWPVDSVIISLGATIGQIGIAKVPTATKQGLAGIVLNRQMMTPEFLAYGLLGQKEYIQSLATGATIKEIRPTRFAETIQLPVPPLAEQQRIVGLLDEAFEGLATAKANAEKNLQNARALFESHLQAVFTQRGPGWPERRFDEVCAITSTLVDPRKREFLDLTHVGAGNIESKTGVFVDLKTAREEGLISGKFLFDDSMVLYSKIRPYLMKVARPDFEGLCSADMYPLSPIQNVITRDYLFHLLLSKHFTDYAIQGSARAGMPKVNRDHLFEFRVWLPDVKKQKRLAANLDSLHKETQLLARLYERKQAALEALKKSLLHQAFTGEL